MLVANLRTEKNNDGCERLQEVGYYSSRIRTERIDEEEVNVSSLLSEVPETRMVLQNVGWETFVALADERRGSVLRMTYNEGVLEMMDEHRPSAGERGT